MPHILYVDLSAKAEQWTSASAVAVANDISWVCFVSGRVKQRVRKLLVSQHGTKNLQYRMLAVMIYVTIRGRVRDVDRIVIDKDYQGQQAEATIKNLLLALIRREKPTAAGDMIGFANVKGSDADKLAKRVFDGEMQADRTVTYREFERTLKK